MPPASRRMQERHNFRDVTARQPQPQLPEGIVQLRRREDPIFACVARDHERVEAESTLIERVLQHI